MEFNQKHLILEIYTPICLFVEADELADRF